MNFQTTEILKGLTAESTELIIRDDKSLSRKDMRFIAQILDARPMLDRLEISGCDLTYAQVKLIIPSIIVHPSLTKIDFSKNQLGSIKHKNKIMLQLARQNCRIHTMNFAYNEVSSVMTLASAFLIDHEPKYEVLFKKSDTLVFLHFSDDEPNFYKGNYPEHSSGFKNYMGGSDFIGDSKKTNTVRAFNRECAKRILEAIHSDKIKSFEDIQKLNERIPSVLFVAEEQGIRAEIVKSLVELKAKVPEEYGIKIDIDRFVTKADAQAAGISLPESSKKRGLLSFVQGSEARPQSQALLILSSAKQAESVPVEIPNISHTVEGFHAWSDAQLRQKLEEMRADPQQMLEWGREIFDAIRTISVVSLRSATLASSLETPMRSMADFLDEFSSAKKIVSDYAKPSRSQKLRRLFVSNADRSAKKLQTLADASGKAKRAGIILENLLPALDNMGSDISRQLMTVNEIVDAYKLVNDAICKLCRVGEVALTEWKDEAKKDIVMLAGSDQIMPNTDPFPVTVLASRLSTLRETSVQVLSYVASHHTQLTVDQKQGEGVFRLRSNVPMLVEKVATFQKQVTSLGRAGLINGAADATRSATQGERERTLLAVMETAKAIENLAGSTQEAMLSIGGMGGAFTIPGFNPPVKSSVKQLGFH